MSLRAVWHLGLLGSLVGAVLAATHRGPAANTTDPLTHAPVSPHPSPWGCGVPLMISGLCAVVLGACLQAHRHRTCRGWGRYHPYMDPVVM
ncbi:envelope glycoprotein J [Human alphaherpesvirus 1]|nr:envelope glycoprotein J [Human alphaherpesvirus 1]